MCSEFAKQTLEQVSKDKLAMNVFISMVKKNLNQKVISDIVYWAFVSAYFISPGNYVAVYCDNST